MIRGVFFVIMQWKALEVCQVVTAIFPPQKSGKGIAANFASTKLLNNQLGPGMIDRCVQVPRSLRLMCPVS